MKKKYKILTLVFTVIFLVSVVTVNAAAFEREPGGYVDIAGDSSRENPYDSVYGRDYAIIYIGNVLDVLSQYYLEELYLYDLQELTPLNDFLRTAENGEFYSPWSGELLYDSITVEYLEFFVMEEDCHLQKLGVHKIGEDYISDYCGYVFADCSYLYANGDTLFLGGIREDLYSGFVDLIYEPAGLYVACYFNGFTPYDELFPGQTGVAALNQQISSLKEQIISQEMQIEGLLIQNTELQTENSDLQSENNSLSKACSEAIDRSNYYYSLWFEKENANALDEILTGTAQSILIFVRGVADLGYSPAPGVNVTIGGLLTVSVIGAFVLFILRLVFGGSKGD